MALPTTFREYRVPQVRESIWFTHIVDLMVLQRQPGSIDNLTLTEGSVQAPTANDVLVKIRAVSLNVRPLTATADDTGSIHT